MENRRLLIELNNKIPKSKKELDVLKKNFLLNDIMHRDLLNNDENPKIDLNQSNIQYKVVVGKSVTIVQDELGFEEEEVELEHDLIEIDFYEEFERALEALFENYKTKFIRELDRKGIYTLEGLEGFKKSKLKKINDFIIELCDVSNIEESGKQLIKEFSEKVYDFISNFKVEDYQISDKLNFNLNKNQLIFLFQTMWNKGVISGTTQGDLYTILEKTTRYKNKHSLYEDMKGVRIQANKLTKGNISLDASRKKLSSIFKGTFFHVD